MRPKPKGSVLDKKIKPNPKYSKVETVINTGHNLRKELERLEEVQLFYKFRNDEIFRRININNLVRLIIEVMKLEHQMEPSQPMEELQPEESVSSSNGSLVDELEFLEEEQEQEEEDIRSVIHSRQVEEGEARRSRVGTARSATSVALGFGELDNEKEPEASAQTPQRPFLLLDVRDPEAFLRSHLVLAESYPMNRLNRCYDYELHEMLRLKNKQRAVIIVYDDDESIANRCATTLTQRGYDNVFMLSGGIRVAGLKFPESLVTSGESSQSRLPEGEVMVLERLLEESIMAGATSRLSRTESASTIGRIARSVSMDSVRMNNFDGPIRTSTAMNRRMK